jgi:molybdopterin/thiamine biosynthesis adenylyltransferase
MPTASKQGIKSSNVNGIIPVCHFANQLGVLGPVPGILGSVQALEAIRVLAGCQSSLQGRLLHCDF